MKYITTTIVLLIAVSIQAQLLEKQVISSTGNDASAGGIHISQTVGETAVETYINGSFVLGQGFQQVEEVVGDTANAIDELDILVDYVLYPNPTVNTVQLDLAIQNASLTLQIVLYNTIGERIETQMVDLVAGHTTTLQFDLSTKSNGLFFIKFYDQKGNQISSVEFVKY